MMEKEILSIEQMTAVLDNAPIAVFVSAVDDRKLLYANRLAKERFHPELHPDTVCYKVAGFEKPCAFCHTEEMNQSQLFVREYQHPVNKRIYQLSGKIIMWAGKAAHIEYIMDITEKKKEEERGKQIEEELRMTFSSIPCGLGVYQLKDDKIYPLFHNRAFYEITGYSQTNMESVEKKTSYLGVHEEDMDLLQEKISGTIQNGTVTQHTYRLWNDKKQEYSWIYLEGAIRTCEDGRRLLYAVYSDAGEQKRLEKELVSSNEKMQDIINAIPGGVAIYKMAEEFETVYFSDGVPQLCGYTVEEYQKMSKADIAKLTYWEDTELVSEKLQKVMREHAITDLEFRKVHRDGHIVWVHLQVRQIGEEEGIPLLHCVFHNISALKEAQLELDHLVNSIPGGIASYRVEGSRFIPTFYSDGVMALSGHNREDYEEIVRYDALDIVCELDRERVLAAVQNAIKKGEVLDISYRIHHKDGTLVWIHLNGRRIGPLAEYTSFYAVFTGMSAETRLFQSMANDTADGIYVIDKSNFELLYVNESKNVFSKKTNCLEQKCYQSLYGKSQPCEFCTLKDGKAEQEINIKETGHFYSTRFRETDWNGIPAYIKYVRDITQEVQNRREKERLEMYFKTVVEKLPGGISVIRIEPDGSMVPEYISDGFAVMNHRTMEEIMKLYGKDVFAGIHPDDVPKIQKKLNQYLKSGKGHCELIGRILLGDGGYIWVKSQLSVKKMSDGGLRIYSVYTDISRDVKEKKELRRQYEELILQHYRTLGPNDLIVGHCNITQNRILEIMDYTDSHLLENQDRFRDSFFERLSEFVVDEAERKVFRETYLGASMLEAFARHETEQTMKCFIQLPAKEKGCYVQIKVNLVETPDSGDITGILTVTDITKQTIEDRILHQLSLTSHDYVIDLDLKKDFYKVLSCNENAYCIPKRRGRHSQRVAYMVRQVIVPKDREVYGKALETEEIRRRVKEGSYTFTYSMTNETGDIRTKNMTVFVTDLRLERICLVCTDITDSVREQQGLLNMMAYTFELMALINISTRGMVVYTRQMVLENLSPYVMEDYSTSVKHLADFYIPDECSGDAENQFCMETMRRRLQEEPAGYDFVFPYHQEDEGMRYKQINVLWGDQNHGTICLVRADVTDMLAAEQQKKKDLEKALEAAEEANRAKSDFLSAMSHDIRTPMNAIMGMTALAIAHFEEPERVSDCLQKISISSRHLLSLINDVLDMSKIDRSQIRLNCVKTSVSELIEQLSAIMMPQAKAAGLRFEVRTAGIIHNCFYGDFLRINQILINILSNAVKFTPEGGTVEFLTEEIPAVQAQTKVRYRFTIRDTGIGMQEEFLDHMFEPFVRDNKATYIEGTGLGLSITKGLVALMEGDIAVMSQEGKGSVFQVELECETAQEEKALVKEGKITIQEKKEMFCGRCFLVAEDNEINAEILCELLAMFGGTTVVKQDGLKTLQAFREAAPGTYDAVLMDIQMPEMNGYETAREIRRLKRQDARTIPIVAMTANAFAEDVQACLDAGMNAHIAKPIDVELLRTTLGKVLGIV